MKRLNMRRFLALALALAVALVLAGCGTGENDSPENGYPEDITDPEYPVSVGDAIVEFRPTRVVSLAPSLTEKIYDLGHGGRLVGISDHQGAYPASLAHLPSYGLAPMPDIQGILSVNPHVVFSVSELPQSAMVALEVAGIPLVILPSYAHSISELEFIYLGISMALDGRTTGRLRGELFLRGFYEQISEISTRVPAEYPPLNAVYLRALDFTVATGDTLEGVLLERLGFVNVAAGWSDWVLDPEEAATPEGQELLASVDVIFFDPDYIDPEDIAESAVWGGINAAQVRIDSQIFERQSLRLLGQLERISQAKLDLQVYLENQNEENV